MSKTWKAVLGVVLIFIFGWASGMICTSLIFRHRAIDLLQRDPAAIADMLERRMTRSLGLDAGQQTKIHALLRQNFQQRRAIQKQIQPQIQALNQVTLHEIDEVLRPDQDLRLHETLERFRARFGRSPLGGAAPANPGTNSPVSIPPPGH